MTLAHPDFQLLFGWLLKESKDVLNKQGAFLPHGAMREQQVPIENSGC